MRTKVQLTRSRASVNKLRSTLLSSVSSQSRTLFEKRRGFHQERVEASGGADYRDVYRVADDRHAALLHGQVSSRSSLTLQHLYGKAEYCTSEEMKSSNVFLSEFKMCSRIRLGCCSYFFFFSLFNFYYFI